MWALHASVLVVAVSTLKISDEYDRGVQRLQHAIRPAPPRPAFTHRMRDVVSTPQASELPAKLTDVQQQEVDALTDSNRGLATEVEQLRGKLSSANAEVVNERRNRARDLDVMTALEAKERSALSKESSAENAQLAARLNSTLRELNEAKGEESELWQRGNDLLRSNDKMQTELVSLRGKAQGLQQDKVQVLESLRESMREGSGLKALVDGLKRADQDRKLIEGKRLRALRAELGANASKERLNSTAALAHAYLVEDTERVEIARLKRGHEQLQNYTQHLRENFERLQAASPQEVHEAAQRVGRLRYYLDDQEDKAAVRLQDVHRAPGTDRRKSTARTDTSNGVTSRRKAGDDPSGLDDLLKLNAGIARAKRMLMTGPLVG